MNKGLFIHLIASMICIAMWLFVVWDETVTIHYRIGLAIILGILNLVLFFFNYSEIEYENTYTKKIKL